MPRILRKLAATSFFIFATCSLADECTIPHKVMMGIAQVESGYGAKPYPFLIGLNGVDKKRGKAILNTYQGRWIESRSFDCLDEENCIAAADALIKNGIYNIDLGMFQINHFFHYKYAEDIASYFDYEKSYAITCKVIEECVAQKGYSWEGISCYHSKTPSKNRRYAENLFKKTAGEKN